MSLTWSDIQLFYEHYRELKELLKAFIEGVGIDVLWSYVVEEIGESGQNHRH